MKRSELDLKRETLERIYRGDSREGRQVLLSAVIIKLWQHLSPLFNKKKNVIVRQQCDRVGKVVWNAYNPATGRSQDFVSSTELLVWIEQNSG